MDPGIFVRRGPGQPDKKSPDNVFFLVLSLFYRSQMVNLSFFKGPEGVQHFPGGVQLFPGGVQLFPGWVQLLISYRNPYNL